MGGGLLASAGLMGIIATPAGAAEISGTSPPFSSLGTFMTDLDGSVAGIAGGGGTLGDTGFAIAEAGVSNGCCGGNFDNNTAFSFGFGPGNYSSSVAGVGYSANLSGNTATSTDFSFGPLPPSAAFSEAGVGHFANLSGNTATAWSYVGFVVAVAGVANSAGAADNVAWAGGQFAGVEAVAGAGEDAGLFGNTAYAYGLFASGGSPFAVLALAGVGSGGDFNDNLAIAQSTFGFAISCAGVEFFNLEGCEGGPLVLSNVSEGETSMSNNMATSGSIAGYAVAVASGGDNNNAAASAVGGGISIADAIGDGNSASALGVAGGSASALADGTNQNADATADGAGSSATAVQDPEGLVPFLPPVMAASTLGGWSDASTSGGTWTVSINGATLVS